MTIFCLLIIKISLGSVILLGSYIYSAESSLGHCHLKSESMALVCVGHGKNTISLLQAFSGFYYVMEFLNITSASSLKNVISKLEAFCSIPWKEVGD